MDYDSCLYACRNENPILPSTYPVVDCDNSIYGPQLIPDMKTRNRNNGH